VPLIDVFISCVPADSVWVEALARHLEGPDLKIFYDQWSLRPGDIIVSKLERAMRDATSALVIVSPAMQASPRALEEYAALLGEAGKRDLRLIPLLVGDVDPPPFVASRVCLRLPGIDEPAFALAADKVARTIRDEPTLAPAAVKIARTPWDEPPTDQEKNPKPAAPTPPRRAEPEERRLAVCYVAADRGYGERLVRHLNAAGLPSWPIEVTRPGAWHAWQTRQRIAHATTVIVLESPSALESADIDRMILEGESRGRQFYSVLLSGQYHHNWLAHVRCLDAHGGRLPDAAELGILRQMAAGERLDLAATGSRSPGRPADAPVRQTLGRLDSYLREGNFMHADLVTTTVLLTQADRLAEGYLRGPDGREMPTGVLSEVDALWRRYTHEHQGFSAQHTRASIDGRPNQFNRLAKAFGWSEPQLRYDAFVQGAGPDGFYPSLRNPHDENKDYQWPDHWRSTVLAVHSRVHAWLEGNTR
jgi:TIR domain/GUN4-like